ncbi:unnamed protein product [Polarella glacialis]|uniref:Sacsin/Nov domain-containing protein n=1 Tax=Polarella glacialis TaxID=89957 RepID=A0A813HYI2_POLGL|nr:unnamed protein product [Polarella glacialis]
MFKELLQNADDAQATEVHFVWDWRSFGTQSLMSPDMARWQGPCLWVHNSTFSAQDFENITRLGAMQNKGSGSSRASQIGRFGLGFNSVYSCSDLPSILSDDVVLFLDPHVRHLRAMGASAAKPGIKLRFLKIDVLDKFRDQFEPYHGMFGCDLTSSTPFQGTLIRLPLRTAETAKTSDICNMVATPASAMETLAAFREAAAQCLIFLQHVKKIQFCWIPAEAPPGAQPIAPPDVRAQDALQYRRLFSSRTLPQSKERRSFIDDLLGRIGLAATPTAGLPPAKPFVAFNLVESTRWSIVPGARQSRETQSGERTDAWRLYLQHDDPEDSAWAECRGDAGNEPIEDSVEENSAEDTPLADETPAEEESSLGENSPLVAKASSAAVPVAQKRRGLDFVPFAGLAVCLTRQLAKDEPRICCFLPLPIQSSLPFLINANFVLRDPTSPSRLDLDRGGLVEPMIHALLEEQAAALHTARLGSA